MREYIFTKRERQIAEAYLGKNLKLDGFKVLASRIRKNSKQLRSDMKLLNSMLEGLRKEK